MSAWYIWTCLGMYPMNPASGEYMFGYPLINKATIQLPNQKELEITIIRNKGTKESSIARINLNGKELPVRSITHQQVMNGGVLELFVND